MSLARPSRLFFLAFMGMELSYLYLLASLLGGPAYTLVLTLLLYPSALLTRFMSQSNIAYRPRFVLEMSLVVLVILVVAGERFLSSLAIGQADILGIVLRMCFCGLIWLLGRTVPCERVSYLTAAFRLQIGLVTVLIFSQIAGSAPPVFLFFLLAPVALFLTRWASSFSQGANELCSPNLGHLLFAAASVIVPGMALILLLSPGVARAIVDWLKNIFMRLSDWLDAQQRAASTPSGEFKFDLSCSMRPEEAVLPPESISPSPSEGATGGISPVVIWIIVFVIFLIIVALIAFALRRHKGKRVTQPAEPVRFQLRMVSLSIFRSLLHLLPRLLRKLWGWLILLFQGWKRHPKQPEEPLISIRALYRNLLRWAAGHGVARIPSQTPLEYLALLEDSFPQQQEDLKRVTEGYLLARYSQRSVSQDEFDRIKEAWQRVAAYHVS
jgi:hypothetical protein